MTPQKMDYITEHMKNVLSFVEYKKNLFLPSIAYTSTRSKTLNGTIYSIFVNNSRPNLAQFLYAHECGHVIFGHCKNYDQKVSLFVDEKIRASFGTISRKYKLPEREWFIPYRNTLMNVAMDMEVNSRLFSQKEWDYMNKEVALLLNKEDSKGIWPQDYGFEPGLTWSEYLSHILMTPKSTRDFFQMVREQQFLKTDRLSREHYTPEEYEELRRQILEAQNNKAPLTDLEKSALSELSEQHNSSNFSSPIPTGTMDGRSEVGSGTICIHYDTYTSMQDLCRQVKEVLYKKEDHLNRRDMLYNYNRRKHNTNVIIPKDRKQEHMVTRKLFVLIDVSGSVPPETVHNFCCTFSTMTKEFQKITFITWNTELVAQWNNNQPMVDRYGGGTYISKGMEYIRTNFPLKNQDMLIVISDFYDDLQEWQQQLKLIHAEKIAINWNPSREIINPGFRTIFCSRADVPK